MSQNDEEGMTVDTLKSLARTGSLEKLEELLRDYGAASTNEQGSPAGVSYIAEGANGDPDTRRRMTKKRMIADYSANPKRGVFAEAAPASDVMEQFQRAVAGFKQQIDGLKQQVEARDGKVAALQDQVLAQQTTIQELQGLLDQQGSEIGHLTERADNQDTEHANLKQIVAATAGRTLELEKDVAKKSRPYNAL
jgi:hypothetical protein